jgi:glycosyltransferase involved in cell wall biosynthesis
MISVIIPVYKDPQGIKDTLESLHNQTLPRTKYEIIVVNDGGDKDTRNTALTFSGVDVIDVVPNKGSYNARNTGINRAHGEYFAFVDADITVPTNWLETGLKLLSDFSYVGGPVIIDEKKLSQASHYYEYLIAFDNQRKFYKYHYCPTANLFISRNLIDNVGLFLDTLRSGGDMEFGNRVYDSQFQKKMYFSTELFVNHPPRGIIRHCL